MAQSVTEDYYKEIIDGKTYFFIKEVYDNPSHFIRVPKDKWLKEARRIRQFRKYKC